MNLADSQSHLVEACKIKQVFCSFRPLELPVDDLCSNSKAFSLVRNKNYGTCTTFVL